MLEKIIERWDAISEREKQLTLSSIGVTFVAAIYFLLWQPMSENLADSQQKLKRAEQTLEWVETNATKLIEAGVTDSTKTKARENLPQLINLTAKQNNISISRIQNRDGKVDIWINHVEFNQLVKWLTILQNKYQVQVHSTDLNNDSVQGVIKVNRLSLSY